MIPTFLLQSSVLHSSDRVVKAAMVPFTAETYLPVTPDNFWSPGQSKEVTDFLQPSRDKLYRLLSSGAQGKLETKFIRFGLVTTSGTAVWVDKFGGVRIGSRETRLSMSHFLMLQRLVPDPWALSKGSSIKTRSLLSRNCRRDLLGRDPSSPQACG